MLSSNIDGSTSPSFLINVLDKKLPEITGTSGEIFVLERIIGRGSFGVVYQGYNKEEPNEKFAIKKYFKHIPPNLFEQEIAILSYLNKKTEQENIVQLYDGYVKEQDVCLITSYLEADSFMNYYQTISLFNIKRYMKELLSALATIHKYGIIHRDIKPDNFLFDIKTGKSLLIDFGLAEGDIDNNRWIELNKNPSEEFFIINENKKRHKSGTHGFMAPEIIFRANYQSTGVDIWAAGVIFLSFLSKKYPIFNLNKNAPIKDEILKDFEPLLIVFGKEKFIETSKKFSIAIQIGKEIEKYILKDGIRELIVRDDIDENGIDFAKKLLEVNYLKRITAEEALKHPFLQDV